jgi:hypothetical protein
MSLKAGVWFLATVGVGVFAFQGLRTARSDSRLALPQVAYDQLSPGYTLDTVGEFPELVVSLVCDRAGPNSHVLYAGTRGNGGVYRFSPRSPFPNAPIIPSTGDQPTFGTSAVSVLMLRDFDGDKEEELIALTSQESPRGQSRAYVHSLSRSHQMMTYAGVKSSWPHGIAFVRDVFGRPTFLSAYCGFGEIVEFRLFERKTAAGFQAKGLESRQLGKVDASGEQIASADLFGQGTNVLVSRGFKFNSAAIEIFARDRLTPASQAKPSAVGLGWTRKIEIRENDQFGNVRFLIGKSRDGLRDLYAWWCVGLADGETEFVHYRLDSGGIVERRSATLGPAHDFWPEENRILLVDADGDSRDEIYFAGRAGKFWRYDLGREFGADRDAENLPAPTLVASFPAGCGPVTAGPRQLRGVRPLYLGVNANVVKLTPHPAPTSNLPSDSDDPTAANDL